MTDYRLTFEKAAAAAGRLSLIDDSLISKVLLNLADAVEGNIPDIISENEKDLQKLSPSDPSYDRLQLTSRRIADMAREIRNVSALPNPVGKILSEYSREDGLKIRRITVPFGVIGVIYESRPNVTLDVFSLCLKSKNASVLKGGSEAINSNSVLVRIIKSVLPENGLDTDSVVLLPAGRDATEQLLNARKHIDLIIPRGSSNLIEYVRSRALVPVIETGAGICHTYFDESGDREKGRRIVNNAKTRRVSVCNALDCLIIHESRLSDLNYIVGLCSESNVLIYADDKSMNHLKESYPIDLLAPAYENSFGTEFLSYKMAVKTVCSIEEALSHIARYGSKHSEAIIAEDPARIKLFLNQVDASTVYANASTAFTDGAQFGLGAEIGISTQKLHARGPMALEALTTYKWIVEGNGNVRS
jgi:glutamate-5-semialdehyde dehydrogenase